MIKMMLITGLGGFAGTCCRFLTYRLCALIWGGAFPAGTFIVNIAGCLIFGLLSGIGEKGNFLTPAQSALLITGFCGGFTTFSTFAGDICILGEKGDWGMSAFYLAASIIIGLAMVWLGRYLIRL